MAQAAKNYERFRASIHASRFFTGEGSGQRDKSTGEKPTLGHE
jgi:hypothetical protein